MRGILHRNPVGVNRQADHLFGVARSPHLDLTWFEAIEYRMTDPHQVREYWEKAIQNKDAILKQIEIIGEAIRTRLNKFD
jgi:hypothetical protein